MEKLLAQVEELLIKAIADWEEAGVHLEDARLVYASAHCVLDATRTWMQELKSIQSAITKQLGREVPDVPLTEEQL